MGTIPRARKRWLLGLLVFAFSCSPKHPIGGPGESPTSTVEQAPGAKRPTPNRSSLEREILIGEMCPQAARGRPAVVPFVARRLAWSDDAGELASLLERRRARQFSVFGWDGRRVGIFSAIGRARVGSNDAVAIGSYTGGSPCQPAAQSANQISFDPECVRSLAHCGLAIAALDPPQGGKVPYEEDPTPVTFATAGACAARGFVYVDVDGDGTPEAFRSSDFLDNFRAPAEEVLAVDQKTKPACEPRFAAANVLPPGDPRDWRGLDIVGVLDVDGDGRREVVATYHYADRHTWAIYSARGSAARLDLVGEGISWRKP